MKYAEIPNMKILLIQDNFIERLYKKNRNISSTVLCIFLDLLKYKQTLNGKKKTKKQANYYGREDLCNQVVCTEERKLNK